MIRCRLSALMSQQRLRIADVARLTGLNRSTVTALYYERTTRIDLQAIDRLCAMFDCSVGDLLQRASGDRDHVQ